MPHSDADVMKPELPRAKGALRNLALDLSAMLLFLTVVLITNDIYLATAVGITASLARIVWQKIHRRPIDQMQWTSLGLIVVLGTATMLTRNALFVKLKPTIVEACVGLYMLRPGWCASYTPEKFRSLIPRRLMVAWGYVWALAMFALAGSNLLVAQWFDQRTWAVYVALAPIVLIVVLSSVGIPLFVASARSAGRSG
jgi:intracellular septation protein A